MAKLNSAGTALSYSTYLAGDALYTGGGIAVDSAGNAYVTGAVRSTNLPTTPGVFQTTFGGQVDGFVTKIPVSAPTSPLTVSTRKKQNLRKALANGIKVEARCPSACRTKLVAAVTRKTAKKFDLGSGSQPVTVAKASRELTGETSKTLTVKFSSRARKQLKNAKKVELSLNATIRQSVGGTKPLTRKITLKR